MLPQLGCDGLPKSAGQLQRCRLHEAELLALRTSRYEQVAWNAIVKLLRAAYRPG